MKVDLHIHSFFSHDAISSSDAICRAALKKGLDGIALTDHDTTAGWDAMRASAESHGLMFVPGMERTVVVSECVVGEVLCLFLEKPVRHRDPEGIAAEVAEQDGLIVAAHPFDRRRPALGRMKMLDVWPNPIAVECLNGRSYGIRANRDAQAYATGRGLPIAAGSDAHTPFEVGNVYVDADGHTLDDLRTALLHRQVHIGGRTSPPVFSFVSGVRKLGIRRLG